MTVAHRRLVTGGVGYLMLSGVIGSEFLPHLDEGAIWARGTLAPSTGPTEGTRVDESGARHSGLAFRK